MLCYTYPALDPVSISKLPMYILAGLLRNIGKFEAERDLRLASALQLFTAQAFTEDQAKELNERKKEYIERRVDIINGVVSKETKTLDPKALDPVTRRRMRQWLKSIGASTE